ncbi:MAG TPA: ABC transporter permease [Candidatus Saccharimonadales bacterium]|nr:ABC transporter permease [Candidatus Saccharimonadales bacterium]
MRENVKMAFRSIAGAKMRTFLTMLGMIIGVSAVVAINSIGQGLKSQITGQVNDLGANLIFVLPGQVVSTNNGKQSFNPTASIGTSTLTTKDVTTIEDTKGVQKTTILSLMSGVVEHSGTTAPGALLIATTASYNQVVESPKIDKGRFLKSSDDDAYVAVIGPGARDTLFGKDSGPVGGKISIRGSEFEVVGVLGSSGSNGSSVSGPSLDDAIFVSVGAARKLTGVEPSIFRVGVKADNQDDVSPTVDRIKSALKKNHGGQEDFSVLTQKDLLSTVSTILNALTSGIAAIAAIALLVGGIGIMNIMLVSVTERTREVGLRKALGATSRMVLSQFLIEAIVLSVLGGGLGVGLAFIGGNLAGRLIKITPVFTPQIIAVAFGISVAVGVIFGIAPAIKAARMRPITALRYE